MLSLGCGRCILLQGITSSFTSNKDIYSLQMIRPKPATELQHRVIGLSKNNNMTSIVKYGDLGIGAGIHVLLLYVI